MTRMTNARIAGSTFLLYIVVGITTMLLSGRATRGEGIAERLASMAQHATDMRVVLVLELLVCFIALALAVALWAITREQDRHLAMLALACRVGEGLFGAMTMPMTLGLLALATATGTDAPAEASVQAIGSLLFAAQRSGPVIAGTLFAVGSTLFCWLLLRGRMIPVGLAWLGVLASLLLDVALPLQLAGVLRGTAAQVIWLPMLAFEVPLGVWLLVKGVAPPVRSQAGA